MRFSLPSFNVLGAMIALGTVVIATTPAAPTALTINIVKQAPAVQVTSALLGNAEGGSDELSPIVTDPMVTFAAQAFVAFGIKLPGIDITADRFTK